MAGSFALVIRVALLLELRILAYVSEAIFAVTVGLLAFGRFCLGSFLYHVLTGGGEFARRTLLGSGAENRCGVLWRHLARVGAPARAA